MTGSTRASEAISEGGERGERRPIALGVLSRDREPLSADQPGIVRRVTRVVHGHGLVAQIFSDGRCALDDRQQHMQEIELAQRQSTGRAVRE